MSELASIQARLGCRFQDEQLLRLALTHPSLAQAGSAEAAHNQRLEFLGDAALGLVLARALYDRFPGANEGRLTQSRARLVNRHALAARARALDLGAHLILSRGEEASGGRLRASALADAYEAILGALLLDQGLAAVQAFILREFAEDLTLVTAPPGIENPKGELQELLQSGSPEPPQYEVVSTSGASHAREFVCAVRHGGRELGRGGGKTKQSAETNAALAALKKLREPPATGGGDSAGEAASGGTSRAEGASEPGGEGGGVGA